MGGGLAWIQYRSHLHPPQQGANSRRRSTGRGERIAELHAAVARIRGAGPSNGHGPAMTKAAEAMKVALRILKAAGPRA